MKLARATQEESEKLLAWLRAREAAGEAVPPFERTIMGYLLLVENCADPEKPFIDWKPGTSPAEIEALRVQLAKAREKATELENSLAAWHSTFQTSQLTHAIARLEAAEQARATAESDVETLRQVVALNANFWSKATQTQGECGLIATMRELHEKVLSTISTPKPTIPRGDPQRLAARTLLQRIWDATFGSRP